MEVHPIDFSLAADYSKAQEFLALPLARDPINFA
jgi:hypothetical protein